jgi:Icc-related predicted phosphoesterase
MASRVTRVLCAAEPRGSSDAVDRLGEVAGDRDAQAIVLAGDLGGGQDRSQSYRPLFHALGALDIPAYWVPGRSDAPIGAYLREAHNVEIVFPRLRGVHGTGAFATAHLVVAGFGGEIDDDPDAQREELECLRYPRWEAEYRLKLLGELGEHERMLAFATPPAHKGLGLRGSDAVAELIGTWRPRLVVCGGPRGTEMIGRSLVVAPGSLAEGHYAVADLKARHAELGELVPA